MSLIVSLVTPDNVIMGADSGSYDLEQGVRQPTASAKIFRQQVTLVSENASLHFMTGCVGSIRQRQVYQYEFRPPNPVTKDLDLTAYMSGHYAAGLRDALDYAHALGDEEPFEGSAIIAVYGTGTWNHAPRVYELHSNLGMAEYRGDFAATGANYLIALGAMSAFDVHLWTGHDPEGTVRAAMEITARYSLFCSGPFHLAHLIED